MSCVSVIIPCYRYAHFLPACVESVLAQPEVDLRVLILDDASPDDTPAVAAALAAGDRRVEYRRHAANQGHIATYNDGLAWSSGDYTVLLDADDLLAPGALARAARLLDAHPEVGLVHGPVLRFTSGEPLPPACAPDAPGGWQITPGLDWFKRACHDSRVHIVSPEVVVRTALQHQLGGYRAELPHAGDLEMWLRFALHADVGRIVDTSQAYYRLHPHNMHKTLAPTPLLDLRQRKAAFDAVFQSYSQRLASPAPLHWAASRRLAREALGRAAGALDRGAGGAVQAAELTRFAFDAYPGAALTPEFLGLRLRRLLGPRAARLLRASRDRFFNLYTQPSSNTSAKNG